MAHIFPTFRKRRDPDTGKRIPVLDAKGKPVPHTRWRGEYVDWRGQRHVVTLTTNRKDSEAMLERMALKHHEIRIGHRPAPTLADKAARRLFAEVAAEYVAWGKTQGGRRGRPWSRGHAHMRQTHLKYWAEQLSCEMLSDLTGCLPQVERAIQVMRQEQLTGKTIANKIEALRSFCLWAMDRDWLAENPLRKLARVDTTPQTNRRDLEPEEIARLLPVCELHRRILYITAIGTGFRANELRMLTPTDLNPANNTIHLAAEYDKARIERFQPVCEELMDLLVNRRRFRGARTVRRRCRRKSHRI